MSTNTMVLILGTALIAGFVAYELKEMSRDLSQAVDTAISAPAAAAAEFDAAMEEALGFSPGWLTSPLSQIIGLF